MSFVSIQFILLLVIVFVLYWFVFTARKKQNALILLASYVFYGWWDWRFMCLLAFTSLCSYLSGIAIERCSGNRGRQKAVAAANVVVNLLILGIFKYYNFFVASFNDLAALMGFHSDWATASIVLPVGISFYTFQALSYSIDVYRGQLRASRDWVAFFAYISFFPQLVAGPIERATRMLPQFEHERHFDYAKAVDGCRQMLWGFFKKMVVADGCGAYVNRTWDHYDTVGSPALVLAAVAFSFQIYCDFSGYSDIALGSARLLGMELTRNFNVPYFARNIAEFWRRWHITLMSWFRDYVYIPLGGSRRGKWRTVVNTLVVFALSGLWHGANWTYVCWGLYHAVLFVPIILLGVRRYSLVVAAGRVLPSLKELGLMLFTFALVTVGWILFRASSIAQAASFLQAMCRWTQPGAADFVGCTGMALGCAVVMVAEWVTRERQHALQLAGHGLMRYRAARWALYVALIVVALLGQSHPQDFIYFQF